MGGRLGRPREPGAGCSGTGGAPIWGCDGGAFDTEAAGAGTTAAAPAAGRCCDGSVAGAAGGTIWSGVGWGEGAGGADALGCITGGM